MDRNLESSRVTIRIPSEESLANFVAAIDDKQARHDRLVSSFVDEALQDPEVSRLFRDSEYSRAQLEAGCDRLMTGTGLVCRDQLDPKERSSVRILVVDWSDPDGRCHWERPDGSPTKEFKLINAAKFCAKHIAGFDAELGHAIAERFHSAVRESRLQSVSLRPIDRGDAVTRYEWSHE